MLKTAYYGLSVSVGVCLLSARLVIGLMAFILMFNVQASAEIPIRKITLSEKNAPLDKVLKKIEDQTDYTFLYEDDVLKKTYPITVQVREASIEQVLTICFKNQPLTYKIFDYTVVVKEIKLSANVLFPPIELTGRIVNNDGKPIVGVSIIIVGSANGTSTNRDGRFKIIIPGDDNFSLCTYGYSLRLKSHT
jgi:hypothetical protein